MKTKLLVLTLALLTVVGYGQKILIVSTNVGNLNNETNGTFLMEIAYPFAIFINAGYDVDIVTPKGGRAEIYHRGELPESLAKIKESSRFRQKTENALSPGQVDPKIYEGIFYPGGGGQFYDVVDNKDISAIAASIYENGGILGSAGHGPASLINIKLNNGEFLLRDKKITCFPKAYSAKWLPFDWEEILKQRGAEVILPTTAVEKDKGVQLLDEKNRIVSGSFAENAQWVAEQMVNFLQKVKIQNEEKLIRAAIYDYIEGRNTGDIKRLENAFLPTATLKSVNPTTKVLVTTSLAEYLARHTPGKKQTCTTEVTFIDYTHNVAVAKVVIKYPTFAYHDYLVLMKVNDKWSIAEKTYFREQF